MIPSARLSKPFFNQLLNNIQRRGIFTVCSGNDSISRDMRSKNPRVFIQEGVDIIERYKSQNSYLNLTNDAQNNQLVPKSAMVKSADIGLVAAEAYFLTDPVSGILRPFALQWMEVFLAKYTGVKHVVIFSCNSAVAIPHATNNPSAIIQFSKCFPDIPFYGVVHPLVISEVGSKFTRRQMTRSGSVTFEPIELLGSDFFCAKNGKSFSAKGIDFAKMLV